MSNLGSGPAEGEAREETPFARFARIRSFTSPPPNEIPGILPLGHFLGRSSTVAAVLLEIHAFTAGLQFRLTYRRPGRGGEHGPLFTPTDSVLAERMGLPTGTKPQVEVELADGARIAAVDLHAAARRLDSLPGRVLIGPHGGGGNDQFDADFWLIPNPRCAVAFRFTWPEQDLPTTTLVIQEHDVQAATAAAVTLWPWDPTADVRTAG